MSPSPPCNFRASPVLIRRLDKAARYMKTDRSTLIRIACEEFLDSLPWETLVYPDPVYRQLATAFRQVVERPLG